MPSTERAHPSNAKLQALRAHVQPSEYTIADSPCLIGRLPPCHVIVSHEEVSRTHARIERRAEGFVLLDAGSANGTYVNGKRLQGECLLRHHDEIGLASSAPLLRFIDQDATIIRRPRLRYRQHERRFWFKDEPLDLSPTLMRLLMCLYERMGGVCTHEELIQAAWQDKHLDQHLFEHRRDQLYREISELRHKLREIDSLVDVIQPHWGTGYSISRDVLEVT